jgi:Carboxypeptidase regulatory-like domain
MRISGLGLGSVRRSLFVAAVALAITVLPILLFGQGYFGTLTGVLTDSSGAVLAHANVVLADQQKGFTFKTTSDAKGRIYSARFHRGCIR